MQCQSHNVSGILPAMGHRCCPCQHSPLVIAFGSAQGKTERSVLKFPFPPYSLKVVFRDRTSFQRCSNYYKLSLGPWRSLKISTCHFLQISVGSHGAQIKCEAFFLNGSLTEIYCTWLLSHLTPSPLVSGMAVLRSEQSPPWEFEDDRFTSQPILCIVKNIGTAFVILLRGKVKKKHQTLALGQLGTFLSNQHLGQIPSKGTHRPVVELRSEMTSNVTPCGFPE